MPQNKNILETIRHSCAHVLAEAVLQMFPEAKLGMGPAIKNGFYYDFDLPRTLIPEDLVIIEKKMKQIIKQNNHFKKEVVDRKKAIEFMKKIKQSYKVDILKEMDCKQVTFYRQGHFVDLCGGPHLKSTGAIGAFKLLSIAGAYWKGDEKNKMLQRVYGTCFATQKELDEYLKQRKEAEKRDHKKIGQELDLFSFHSEFPGSACWHPKGMIIWNEMEKFGKSIRKKYNYQEIQTPQLAKNILWKTSGHWDHYKNEMFYFDVEKETYCLKPMDCPFNIKVYQTKQRSYKELPIRFTEIGHVMRNEKSGELNGLLRVRQITQDDAHIFASPDQVEKEITTSLRMVKEYYKAFGIEPKFFLSTRGDDFMGDKKTWDNAEKNLKNALQKEKIKYELKEKDAAFYGPKIDIDIEDSLGRPWQLATIQLDFQLPARFGLEYIDKNSKKQQPVIIHAAIFGSFERFIGILLEHYAGSLPFWLSPTQMAIIPVSNKFNSYAKKIFNDLSKNNVRVELNDKDETLGKRISKGEKQKIPYMIVVGDKEQKTKNITVRKHNEKKLRTLSLNKFTGQIKKEIENKK
jgi:threonyl-tRNA synthetase